MSAVLEPADERLATLSLARLADDELERLHLQLFHVETYFLHPCFSGCGAGLCPRVGSRAERPTRTAPP